MPDVPARSEASPGQDHGPTAVGHPAAAEPVAGARDDALAPDESYVELRCAVVIDRGDEILVIKRPGGDWVLPGGRPRSGESLVACARREAREETGLLVDPTRCAFIGEVTDPVRRRRVVELTFLAELHRSADASATVGEPGCEPQWVHRNDLRRLDLRPPIAGYLPGLLRDKSATAPYLGNLWRGREDAVDDPTWA